MIFNIFKSLKIRVNLILNFLGVIANDEDFQHLLVAIDDDLNGTIDCWELLKYIDRIMADEFT